MNHLQMLTDERAWRANTIDETAFQAYPLSEACLEAIQQESPLDVCGDCLGPVLDTLNSGRGFAIIERIPVERYKKAEAQAIYRAIGQWLGVPFEQDIKGTLLYDVRDTGQQVTQGARFSVTNAESSFHTDNSFGTQLPDFVGLLCMQTAKSGGQSQLISAYTLHNELLENHPDALETLYQPFCFDRRGQFKKGESPVYKAPIFHWDGQTLTTRYMHYYIQVGYAQVSQKLSRDKERALDVLEGLLRRPDFSVAFNLRPGQMLFTNNHWILHNRTAFEDYLEPERRRHLVRLWLRRRNTFGLWTK